MGWFSRNDSGAARKQSDKPRPSVSSEAQAAELRARARRRLAGAIALVLAAIVVLPMVLDSEPVPVADDVAINMPQRDTPYQPPLSAPQAAVPDPVPDSTVQQGQADPTVPPTLGSLPGAPAGPANGQPTTPPAAAVPPSAQPSPPAAPETAKPAPPAKPDNNRSDDGSRAIAMLEGRNPGTKPTPPTSKPPAGGGYVLQIAAYTAQADAQGRRDKLHQAGVTNAFVEPVSASGKQQFRLRVGPFPSREAAQAAQARLRTLGYDNGFIAAQ